MFTATLKLSNKSREFVQFMNNNALSMSQQAYVALAKALSVRIAVPTEKVSDFVSYFNVTYKVNLLEELGHVNELTLIDIETVLEYTRMFLNARYLMLFPDPKIYCFWEKNASIQFFGINKVMPQAIIELIDADYRHIVEMVDGYADVLADLLDEQAE